MNKQTAIAIAIGMAVILGVVSSILLSTRKNRVELHGDVLKVRSHQIDPEHTLALIDFRVNNPSTQQFVVREVEVFIDEPDGKSTAADVFSEDDVKRVFSYYGTLGQRYTPGLLRKDKLDPGDSTDRSVGVSAPMTDQRLQNRKAIRIVVHDVDGPKTEIVEKR